MEDCIIIIFPSLSPALLSSIQPRTIRSFVWYSLLKSFYQLIKTAFFETAEVPLHESSAFPFPTLSFSYQEGEDGGKPFQTSSSPQESA